MARFLLKLSRYPIHSIVLSLYPIVYLIARNFTIIRVEDALRSLALSAGFGLFFLLSFRIILKSWEKAGAVCSLMLILFFSFGHIANGLGEWAGKNNISFGVHLLGWLWLVVFLVILFMIIRSQLPERFTQFLNIVTASFLAFTLATFGVTVISINRYEQSDEILPQMRDEAGSERSVYDLSQDQMPDIYYIILDSYARADKLKTHYDYDNDGFIEALEERGFYILTSSRSNYLTTNYSLNTSLNMIYFHDYPKSLFIKSKNNLLTNHVNDFLRERGYKVVVFQSGTGDTDTQHRDIYVSSPMIDNNDKPAINSFEQLLIKTTLGVLITGQASANGNAERAGNVYFDTINRELDIRRERVNYAFARLPDFASQEGNYFLFAHVYSPHFPFLFGPDGESLAYHGNTKLFWYEPEPENYIEGYTSQITYLNRLILSTVDRILAESKRPVVIILQSDHGDGRYIDWDEPTTEGVDIRSAILNAIYFSDGSYQALYPTMTPVNTFRVVFNHWFGTSYPLLPDKVYFHERPTLTAPNVKPEFIDACVEYEVCLPAVR